MKTLAAMILLAATALVARAALCIVFLVSSDDPTRWSAPATIITAPEIERSSPTIPQTVRIAFDPAVFSAPQYGHVSSVSLNLYKDRDSDSRKRDLVFEPPPGMPRKEPVYVRPDSEAQKRMFLSMKQEGSQPVAMEAQEIAFDASVDEFHRYALVIQFQSEATIPCAEGYLAFFLSGLPRQAKRPDGIEGKCPHFKHSQPPSVPDP